MFHSDVETFSVLIAKNMHILMLWYVISNHVAPRIRVKKSSLSFCRWYGKLCSQPKSTGAYLHSVFFWGVGRIWRKQLFGTQANFTITSHFHFLIC